MLCLQQRAVQLHIEIRKGFFSFSHILLHYVAGWLIVVHEFLAQSVERILLAQPHEKVVIVMSARPEHEQVSVPHATASCWPFSPPR
jgi:hypothetical protein